MSAAGLQELAEALLQTLAIESHEKELQHLAHRARIWQDARKFRSERDERSAQKKLRQLAKLATDTRRYQERSAEGKGPRRPESDSSGEEQKESSSSESPQEEEVLSEHIKSTLSLAVPKGYHVCASAPPLDNRLVGRLIAFRWNIGWEVGTVKTVYLRPVEIKKRKRNETGLANTDIKFPSDSHARDICLKAEWYVIQDTNKLSRWCCIEPS